MSDRRRFRIAVTDRAFAAGPMSAIRPLVESESRIVGNPPAPEADWSLTRHRDPACYVTVFTGDFPHGDPDGAAIEDALANLAHSDRR